MIMLSSHHQYIIIISIVRIMIIIISIISIIAIITIIIIRKFDMNTKENNTIKKGCYLTKRNLFYRSISFDSVDNSRCSL